jgi:metal-dependent HD superfamily phosphatase/phosphodiesterase
MITYEQITSDRRVKTYIEKANDSLAALGYTEHSFPHVTRVAKTAGYIMKTLGYSEREVELTMIAGHLHDIGNLVNRQNHALSGAVMSFRILSELGVEPDEIATIVTAIGNHDEGTAEPVNPVTSALILADKCDVRRSRVRNRDFATFDIHDRVNYAVTKSELIIDDARENITLTLAIDTDICSVTDYFEIFLTRMILCRRAADKLKLKFGLIINGQRLM